MKTAIIYKIERRDIWQQACDTGLYTGSKDDMRDGFIHFSTAAQAKTTLEKYFAGVDGLMLIGFRTADFDPNVLKFEPSRGGDLFPHLYSDLDPILACDLYNLPLSDDGTPILPSNLPT